jgi:serine/threonine protein kinase
MTQFIESFFDSNTPNFKLWSKKVADAAIPDSEVLFKGPMLKMSRKTNKLKERLFVLTSKRLYYLKSAKVPKVRGSMDTEWVRCEYLMEEHANERRFCIRFIKNLKYCDFWVEREEDFREWKARLSRVFIQSDFHEKFNAIKMIGKGSFARVYLVEDKITHNRFAVKAFSKEYLQSQSKGKDSLINEIQVMQRLEHQNIMHLQEVHESKNSIYLVLELLEGGELFNFISSKSSIAIHDVGRMMRHLLDALAYLADKRIMHRDLKPENMILKEKTDLSGSTLKLVDFGLSTLCDVPEYLFKRCGTPGYVAPEIINAPSNENVHYTPKCDVFSAGIIFYIMLVGRSPFDGKSFQEILKQNKLCKIDFKHPKLKKHPHCIELLQKMLEIDPARRLSAREALDHAFFKAFGPALAIPEPKEQTIVENIQEFREQTKRVPQPLPDGASFVQREGLINGEVNTVNDSNSDGGILSLKNMAKRMAATEANSKRESIYKYVLVKENAERIVS